MAKEAYACDASEHQNVTKDSGAAAEDRFTIAAMQTMRVMHMPDATDSSTVGNDLIIGDDALLAPRGSGSRENAGDGERAKRQTDQRHSRDIQDRSGEDVSLWEPERSAPEAFFMRAVLQVPCPTPTLATLVLHPIPYTLHPTPYTLHPTPCTLNTASYPTPQNPKRGNGKTQDVVIMS